VNSEVHRSGVGNQQEAAAGNSRSACESESQGKAGINDSDDFTTEGGSSVMATPQKQRLCEEDDPDIANLLQTPDSSSFERASATDFDAIPGSLSLFQGGSAGVMRRSPVMSVGDAADESDRFNSTHSSEAASSALPLRTRTPPHIRAISRVPIQLDVSAFTAPRIVSSSFFCGWTSLWGGGEESKNSRTPSPQNTSSGSKKSGGDALLSLWSHSNRWLFEILEPNWRVASQSSKVRSLWRKGVPPHVRGKVWKKAIGNKLAIEPDLYEYNRNQARAVFRLDAASASATTSAPQVSGSFRSPSPWIVQDDRSSSAQPFATRDVSESMVREQGRGMRRVSSSGLLQLSEDGTLANSIDQVTWFDWSSSGGASGAFSPVECSFSIADDAEISAFAGVAGDAFGSRKLAVPEQVRSALLSLDARDLEKIGPQCSARWQAHDAAFEAVPRGLPL
jgi:hypothetical protein